jgi:hypothetical protein
MNILYMLDNPYAFGSGCWLYRNHYPAQALRAKGHMVKNIVLGRKVQQEWLDYPDVVVFSRTYPIDPIVAVRQFKRAGKKVVYEIDDDLWNVNPDNPSVSISTKKRVQYEKLMKEVDVVTTTTPELAKLLRKFNKNVVVCPNAVDYEIFKEREGGNGYREYIDWWQQAFSFNTPDYFRVLSDGYALNRVCTDEELDYVFRLMKDSVGIPAVMIDEKLGVIKKERPALYEKIAMRKTKNMWRKEDKKRGT